MVEFETLKQLEKNPNIRLDYCDYIADQSDEEENIRIRILQNYDGKYYYHKMQHGNVLECFEIAFSWEPFHDVKIFAFTPDGIHIYEIDTRNLFKFESKKIDSERITPGLKCDFRGNTIEYITENAIKINNNVVKVEANPDYIYKCLKTKIKAQNGAKGLYQFFDKEAEAAKLHYSAYDCLILQIIKQYS